MLTLSTSEHWTDSSWNKTLKLEDFWGKINKHLVSRWAEPILPWKQIWISALASSRLLRCYDVPPVCKTCCSLKVCANRSYYAHSSPPPPFYSQTLSSPSSVLLSLSFSFFSVLFFLSSVSLISSVLNSVNSGQECPDKLVKNKEMTSSSTRRWQTGRTSRLTQRTVRRRMDVEDTWR